MFNQPAQQDPHPNQFKFVFFLDGKKVNSRLSYCPADQIEEKIDDVREWLKDKIDHAPGFLCWGPEVERVGSLHALQSRLEQLKKNTVEVPV